MLAVIFCRIKVVQTKKIVFFKQYNTIDINRKHVFFLSVWELNSILRKQGSLFEEAILEPNQNLKFAMLF